MQNCMPKEVISGFGKLASSKKSGNKKSGTSHKNLVDNVLAFFVNEDNG